jgi:hypothetical protein
MSPDTRACVAYAALRLISSRDASAIFDCSRSIYTSIAGTVSNTALHLYDFSRNSPFGGKCNNGEYQLYDFEQSSKVDLRINGQHYEGFDHGSLTRFSGTVQGDATSLYDYATDGYFDYVF